MKSIEATLKGLSELGLGEQIYSILYDIFYHEFSDSNSRETRSSEEKLRGVHRRYHSEDGQSSINLYPSSDSGACHPFCLAIANKKFDKPRKGLESGFEGIMLEMAAYWIGCIGVNKETLILTSSWDNEIFCEEYKKIIDNYTSIHNKRVFIIEVGQTGFFCRYPY